MTMEEILWMNLIKYDKDNKNITVKNDQSLT